MHNSGTPTPRHPLQLPLRLLKDGWWLDEADPAPSSGAGRRSAVCLLRIIEGGLKENANDRNDGYDACAI
jgi:hypothetical protein